MIGLYVILPNLVVQKFTPAGGPHLGFFNLSIPSPTPTPTPSPTPALVPVTLIIPKLKIQAPVEQVGLTPTNNMDVPKDAADAAWYMHGPKPAEEGNAVISAHYDTPTGKPALFYYLNKLEVGDGVEVISNNAVHSTFVVTEKSTIPYDTFPNEFVFKSKPGRNLNLITCSGIWDPRKKIYSDRIVVYTTLKQE